MERQCLYAQLRSRYCWKPKSWPQRPPRKQEHIVRPNRDIGKLRLGGVLALAGQFLDGSLDQRVFSCARPASEWKVDMDMQRGLQQQTTQGIWHAFNFSSSKSSAHCAQLRLDQIDVPAKKLMRIHFTESLRALGRLGGGILADDGMKSAEPWTLGHCLCLPSSQYSTTLVYYWRWWGVCCVVY